MIKDYLLIIVRNFSKRKLRGWLTMIGIFIGIASVVALMGLGEGLREGINSQFGFLGTDIISVTASGGFGPPGTGTVDSLTDKELDEIRKIKGVDDAAARILESVKFGFNNKVGFGYAASMPDGRDRKVIEHLVNMEATKGKLLEDGDSGVVVLGFEFNKDDNTFEKIINPGDKIKVQDQEFIVIGILEKKGNFQIDGAVFMNEDDLRNLVDREEDDYDIIVVKFDENIEIDKIQADIEKKLRKVRDVEIGEENFAVETPASILGQVNSILLGVQIFVYIIAGISLLVGGIGIMNTMSTAVLERTKEIGIMKSIGAKNSMILQLFLIESGVLGAVGGIIGAVLGFLIATGMAYAGRLALGSDLISAHISPILIIGAISFSFILGSIFGTLPAIKASKLKPVEALRYE